MFALNILGYTLIGPNSKGKYKKKCVGLLIIPSRSHAYINVV